MRRRKRRKKGEGKEDNDDVVVIVMQWWWLSDCDNDDAGHNIMLSLLRILWVLGDTTSTVTKRHNTWTGTGVHSTLRQRDTTLYETNTWRKYPDKRDTTLYERQIPDVISVSRYKMFDLQKTMHRAKSMDEAESTILSDTSRWKQVLQRRWVFLVKWPFQSLHHSLLIAVSEHCRAVVHGAICGGFWNRCALAHKSTYKELFQLFFSITLLFKFGFT